MIRRGVDIQDRFHRRGLCGIFDTSSSMKLFLEWFAFECCVFVEIKSMSTVELIVYSSNNVNPFTSHNSELTFLAPKQESNGSQLLGLLWNLSQQLTRLTCSYFLLLQFSAHAFISRVEHMSLEINGISVLCISFKLWGVNLKSPG